ncbi:hypothetical protein FOZ60_006729 [Perkinsus olseni]|uniref:Uncharacterized protein n=1 Tax=Perkinsus olseni TaxID=32597 RepID=A0A7J6PGJ5_PEROL|nr:hypothetical protein FOZ60_006729 [Perkinsus olseni]
MRILVKAQGEVYPKEVRENVPYFGGLQAVRKEISYVPSEPAALDPCRPSLPIPTVDRPHPLSNPVASGVHKMCAGETRTVVCAGPQVDPGSPDGFDVTMIPQPTEKDESKFQHQTVLTQDASEHTTIAAADEAILDL